MVCYYNVTRWTRRAWCVAITVPLLSLLPGRRRRHSRACWTTTISKPFSKTHRRRSRRPSGRRRAASPRYSTVQYSTVVHCHGTVSQYSVAVQRQSTVSESLASKPKQVAAVDGRTSTVQYTVTVQCHGTVSQYSVTVQCPNLSPASRNESQQNGRRTHEYSTVQCHGTV
eukprot:5241058-Pyramimonas_sp.AAC.1